MNHTPIATAAPGHDADGVLFALIRISKMLGAARPRHAPTEHRVDGATYPLLFAASLQPRRVSELAACVHSDVSTVSRQVSALVGQGMLERLPDPDDGRAQVVSVTDEGQRVIADLRARRAAFAAELLQEWSDEEVAALRGSLERLVTTVEERLQPTPHRNENP